MQIMAIFYSIIYIQYGAYTHHIIMLEQYDGDVLSNIIDKVLIYNDKDIEVVFKGENFIRNAV